RCRDDRRACRRIGDGAAVREERLVEAAVDALEELVTLLGHPLGRLQGRETEARQLRVGPRREADAIGRRHLGASPPALLAIGGFESDATRGCRAERKRPRLDRDDRAYLLAPP